MKILVVFLIIAAAVYAYISSRDFIDSKKRISHSAGSEERMARRLMTIEKAFEELYSQKGDDWFMIIEDPDSKKFVQFAWDETGGLLFDLPDQALDDRARGRALKLLQPLGVNHDTWEVYDAPGGKVMGVHGGFNKYIGDDKSAGISLAKLVFSEVYNLSEIAEFTITIDR